MEQKKFWQSSNFYLNLVLLVGAFFVGFPNETAQSVVYGVFAAVGGVGILRNFFKDASFNAQEVKKGNFWAYVGAILVSVLPALTELPEGLTGALERATEAAFNQNWQSLLIEIIAIVNILANTVFKRSSGDAGPKVGG